MKTTNICQIGSTIFRPGVEFESVIKRAEREYIYNHRCVECHSTEDLQRLDSGDLMCEECAENI